ncbi:hypothetical protein AB0M57_04455 [Streptomyces sp. NPDC051597]|uniref:hypothetical protein n=1 Tax=Streptomyces sp. NPDC051597 TaxID=3155049 RepID=UPI00342F63D9
MPDRTPAETLNAAADKLHKLAAQADNGPWETTWRGQEYHLDGYRDGDLHPISEWTYAIATWEPKVATERADRDTANPDYIAAMHPGVGAAIADWLEATADYASLGVGHPTHVARAFAVARRILGEVA